MINKFSFLIFFSINFLVLSQTRDEIIEFEDPTLLKVLLKSNEKNSIAEDSLFQNIKIDANNDGKIQISEVRKITLLDIRDKNITSLSGLSFFKELKQLLCSGNLLKNIKEIENLKKLETFDCAFNKMLTEVSFKNFSKLQYIDCSWCSISKIELDELPNLKYLMCGTNSIKFIDLTKLHNIEKLDCRANNLTVLNLNNLKKIKNLECSGNYIKILDIENLTNLQEVDCSYNEINNLNFSGLNKLKSINCSFNRLKSLNLKTDGEKLNNLKFEGNRYIVKFCYNDLNYEIIKNANKENLVINNFCN